MAGGSWHRGKQPLTSSLQAAHICFTRLHQVQGGILSESWAEGSHVTEQGQKGASI